MAQMSLIGTRELIALRARLSFWRMAARLLGVILFVVALVLASGGNPTPVRHCAHVNCIVQSEI